MKARETHAVVIPTVKAGEKTAKPKERMISNRIFKSAFDALLDNTHIWFCLSDRTFLPPSSWRSHRTPLISPLNYSNRHGQYVIPRFDSITRRLQQPRRMITTHTVDEKPKATPKTPHIISSTIKTGRLPNRSASGAYIGADKDSVTIITDSCSN